MQARVLRFRWMNMIGSLIATVYNAIIEVWPFAAIGGIVTMTAALTFGLTRYRVPADFALVVLGAVGAAAVGHLIRSRLRPAEPADAGDETEWTTTAG